MSKILKMSERVNFREVRTSGIAKDVLYRCSHPVVCGKQDRDIAQLASAAKIESVINLCDDETEIGAIASLAPWYRKIYNDDHTIALDMHFDFRQGEFTEKLKSGFHFMTISPSPFLVHCYAGFDRTGIFCAVLEALMGATQKEIGDDYSFSYKSNCDSEFYEFDNKYHGHIILEQLENLYETKFSDKNLQRITEEVLIEKVDLSVNEISLLKQKLSKT